MALDRTWYNTLVDDDGSNTVGSVWNKASVDALMDATDAVTQWEFIGLGLPTGTINDWNPGIVGNTWVHCQGGTGPFTFTGLKPAKAPIQGQLVHILNETGQTITMVHQSGSSTGSQLALQGGTKTFASYWSWARFQYMPGLSGGLWVCLGFANGHGY